MEDLQDSCHSDPRIMSIADELKDDTYINLINDFFGPQTGYLLNLNQKPCTNRFLVQISLMRVENNVPWKPVEKWLQKILPVFQTANFRGLIDWNTETVMSLSGEARKNFLQKNINFDFIGPICDSIGIDRTDLLDMTDFSDRGKLLDVTNGLILELTSLIEREEINPVVLVSWLRNFDPSFCSDGKIQRANKLLQVSLKRFRIQYRNSQTSRNKNSGLFEEFLQRPFELSPDLDESEFRSMSMMKGPFRKKRLQVAQGISFYKSSSVEANDSALSPVYKKRRFVTEEDLQSNTDDQKEQLGLQKDRQVGPDGLTLFDIAIMSLQKLSAAYEGTCKDAKLVSMDLLKHQFSLMLQKDSKMNSFNEKVLAHASGENPQVAPPEYFLQCNSLFFFNLINGVEEQIMRFENEIEMTTGEKLGRNKTSKFKSFLNFDESVVTRYVTMACEILCPKKETCRGYRKHWLAFCIERNNPSRLPISQSNRFIVHFEAAAALLHHSQDVALFVSDLQQLNNDSNIFLDSVNADANDEVIRALLCVVAIVYCKVLGPLWQLLKSDAQYSSFHKYAFQLYEQLLTWSRCDTGLLKPDHKFNVFLQDPIQQRNLSGIFAFCQINEENQYGTLIKACLQKLMVVFASMMEENLKEFLPGGKYSNGPSDELAQQLASCTFSQLMGEYPFHAIHYKNEKNQVQKKVEKDGQLGFSPTKPKADGCLQKRQYHKKFPVIHKANIRSLKVKKRKKVRRFIDEQQRAQMQEEEKQLRRKAVIKAVANLGGPCQSCEDVDQMLARMEGSHPSKRREAIRSQLNYLRYVVGLKDERLHRLGFCLADMIQKLKSFLPSENTQTSSSTKSTENVEQSTSQAFSEDADLADMTSQEHLE